MTKRFNAYTLPLAVNLLKQGELVAIPTETVYGLAADITQPQALEKVFNVKRRPKDNPLIVHISNYQNLAALVHNPPSYVQKLAKIFWPGPLTMVFKKSSLVHPLVTANQDTVAVRVPNHPITLKLLASFPFGLAAPSANRFTQLSPTTASDVLDALNGDIAGVLDGGQCDVGIESTIVDCTGSTPNILRQGQISQAQIEQAIAPIKVAHQASEKKVPGQYKKHYSPSKQLILVDPVELKDKVYQLLKQGIKFCGLGFTPITDGFVWHTAEHDHVSYAKNLYRTLRTLDKLPTQYILVEKPPQFPEWAYIHDKLQRAACPIKSESHILA